MICCLVSKFASATLSFVSEAFNFVESSASLEYGEWALFLNQIKPRTDLSMVRVARYSPPELAKSFPVQEFWRSVKRYQRLGTNVTHFCPSTRTCSISQSFDEISTRSLAYLHSNYGQRVLSDRIGNYTLVVKRCILLQRQQHWVIYRMHVLAVDSIVP